MSVPLDRGRDRHPHPAAGPFAGANLAQTWWFSVGVLGAVYLATTTGAFAPEAADPSSLTTSLGLGWVAATIVIAATIATNAGNLTASALAISNMAPRLSLGLRPHIALMSIIVVPLALVPLLAAGFHATYIFWLDFLGAIVVPLWVIVLVDFFWVRRRSYEPDMFRTEGGRYWYGGGANWRAIAVLVAGTAAYWLMAYGFPDVREAVPAALPVGLGVAVAYAALMRPERALADDSPGVVRRSTRAAGRARVGAADGVASAYDPCVDAHLEPGQRRLLDSSRRATLATIDPLGRPRLVPICYVVGPGSPLRLFSPIDEKPKAAGHPLALARVRDILARPDVTILVDRWDEDWSRLGWLRLGGTAGILEPGDGEHGPAVAGLRAKYPQYLDQRLEGRPIIRVTIERTTSWGDLG